MFPLLFHPISSFPHDLETDVCPEILTAVTGPLEIIGSFALLSSFKYLFQDFIVMIFYHDEVKNQNHILQNEQITEQTKITNDLAR